MKMFQTVERSYQDKKTGEDKTIKSKEIIVSDGYHSMLVEATALSLPRMRLIQPAPAESLTFRVGPGWRAGMRKGSI